MHTNIGYCLSTYLSDYGIDLDPRICYILSNALWLGLNTENSNKYTPIQNHYISYTNPYFIENFSVNSNCLISSFKFNQEDQIRYLIQRNQYNKKALIKLSDGILNDSEKENQFERKGKPLVALVTGNNKNEHTEKDYTINLSFSDNDSLTKDKETFLKYWVSQNGEKLNSEWYILTPPVLNNSSSSIERKLRIALIKQLYLLQSQTSTTYTGSAVLSFLLNSIQKGNNEEFTSPDNHTKLWNESFLTYHPVHDFSRKYFASCLMYIEGAINENMDTLINASLEAGDTWSNFYEEIKNNNTSKATLIKYYKVLQKKEEALYSALNLLVNRLI